MTADRCATGIRIVVTNDSADTGAPAGHGMRQVTERSLRWDASVQWTHRDGTMTVDLQWPA
jgi:hypothetical protein